jgi:hypothetical protein
MYNELKLILDADGAPVLHEGDVIALRNSIGHYAIVPDESGFKAGIALVEGDEPLIVLSVDDARIHFKRPFSRQEHWVFKHDVEVKLLARPNDGDGDGED